MNFGSLTRITALCLTPLIGTAVWAGPNGGVQIGAWNVSPYISAAYIHDSNPALSFENEREDNLVELHGGIHLESEQERFSFNGDVWGTDKTYEELNQYEDTDFGDKANIRMRSKGGTQLSINQEYYNVEDIDRLSSSIEEIEVHHVGGAVDKQITDKTHLDASYLYTDKEYTDTERYSFSSHRIGLEGDYKLTDKTAMYTAGKYTALDGDSNTGYGEVLDGILGLTLTLTEKLDAKLGAGIMDLDSDDGDEQEFSYEAQLNYAVTDKVTLNFSGHSEIEPSSISPGNYVTVSRAEISIVYTIFSSLRLKLEGSYREFDLHNLFLLGDEFVHKKEDLYSGIARLDYQTQADSIELFLIGEMNDQNSTIDSIDYDQYSLTAGISIQY